MTYKEYYETLHSVVEIKCAAADDIISAQIINPDRIDNILNAANEVLKEKFSYDVSELPFMRK